MTQADFRLDPGFRTIFGRNLVGELKKIVQRPYLVVTMDDLWPIFEGEFDEDCIPYFVHDLEFDSLLKSLDELPQFEAVIGLGGGQAVDVAKVSAWKTHKPRDS